MRSASSVRSQLAGKARHQHPHRCLIEVSSKLGKLVRDGSHPPRDHEQMSIGRPAIIAVQAIVVGVLVVVVYPHPAAARGRGHALRGRGGSDHPAPGPRRRPPRRSRGSGGRWWGQLGQRLGRRRRGRRLGVRSRTAGTAVAPPRDAGRPTTIPESEPDDSEEELDDPGGEPAPRTPTSIRTRSRGSPNSFADADARGRSRRAADPG